MKDILLKRKNNKIQNYNNNIQTLNINDKNNISNESESVIKNEDIKRQVINEKEINYTPIYQNLKSTGLVQSIPPTPFSIPLPLIQTPSYQISNLGAKRNLLPFPNNNNTDIINFDGINYNSRYEDMNMYEINQQINYTTSTYRPYTTTSPKIDSIDCYQPNYQKQNSFLQGNNSFKHNFNLDASQLFNCSSNTPINSIDNSIIYSKSPIPTNEFQKTGLLEKNKNELLNIKRQRTSIPLTSPIIPNQNLYPLRTNTQNWFKISNNGFNSGITTPVSPTEQVNNNIINENGLNFDNFEKFNVLGEEKTNNQNDINEMNEYNNRIIISEKEGKASVKVARSTGNNSIDNENSQKKNELYVKKVTDNYEETNNVGNIPSYFKEVTNNNEAEEKEQEKEEIDDTQGNNHNNAKHFSSAKNEIISNSSGFDINNSKKLFNTTSLSPVIPKQSNKKIKKTESNVSKQKKKISKNS